MNSEFCFVLINIRNNSIIDLARAMIIDLCRVPVSCLEFNLCPANILYHNTRWYKTLFYLVAPKPFFFFKPLQYGVCLSSSQLPQKHSPETSWE